MKNILLVIDMQNGFANEELRQLALEIRKHIKKVDYDDIIFTKFINKNGSNYMRRLKWTEMTSGSSLEIVDELKELAEKSIIVEKNTYSIFKSSMFKEYIGKQVETVKMFICGVDTDACILATAFECFDIGYSFEVIESLVWSSETNMDSIGKQIIRRNISFK